MLHLACASTHLTAFWATAGGPLSHFSVNMVHPMDDAGHIAVRCEGSWSRLGGGVPTYPVPRNSEHQAILTLTHARARGCHLPAIPCFPVLSSPTLSSSSPSRPPYRPRLCTQTAMDPTNFRPILSVILLGCCLGALAYFTRGLSASEAADLRRAVYTAKGTFLTEVAVKDAPQDVRRRSIAPESAPSTAVGAGFAPSGRRSSQTQTTMRSTSVKHG